MQETDKQYLASELERKRQGLIKALGQGERVKNLGAAPEWEFFEGWIQAIAERANKNMRAGAFINDHNGYIYASAVTSVVDDILKGVARFKKAYDIAAKELDNMNAEEKASK